MASTLFANQIITDSFYFLAATWWLWLPVLLVMIFWETWVGYVRASFNYARFNNKYLLLEIKVPRDVAKSPKAMESILAGLHGTNRRGNAYERYWDGWMTAWFSLEIVGDSTGIHFYIWGPAFFKRMLESQIYAQYPSCEIRQVEDYVKTMPLRMPSEGWNVFGSEFLLAKPDAYPIRTYEEFQLEDLSLKEEERKIDPLAPLIEFLGVLKGSEKLWIQVLVKPSGDKWKKEGEALMAKMIGKKVKVEADRLGKTIGSVNDIVSSVVGTSTAPEKKDNGQLSQILYMSPGELEVVKAVEKNIAKIGFDVGIRWIYFAQKDDYNYLALPAMLGVFKQFASPYLNGFKLNKNITTSIDYVFKKTRLRMRKSRIYNAYRLRSYFHPPYRGKPFVLSSSELATIYHFPGMVAGAPAMERIEAKRGAPPTNLPI